MLDQAAIQAWIGLFLIRVARWLMQGAHVGPDERRPHMNETFLDICAYITEHCNEKLTLEDMAAYSGYSKYHFSRIFKEYTGMSFYDFYLRQRMLLCRQLLGEKNLSITEVASRSGFGSLATFNRVFKQYEGVTPTQYRQLKQIKGRGNSTWNNPKKPYQIKLKDPADLLGINEPAVTWVLLANYYDHTFLGRHITEGKLPVYALGQNENEIVISSRLAKEMGLRLGDKVFAYFLEDNVRMRRFHVAGIYNTDMSQFDDNIVLTNLYTVNQLNGWDTYQSSNLELQLNDFAQLDQVYPRVVDVTRDLPAPIGGSYVAYTVKQLYAQIYDWLQLLNLNIWIILGLMIVLASLTMVSGLLILILEKTSTIGILKALGATGRSIRHIFIYYATFIIGRGLILGYALGLGLSFIQYQWHPITLNPEKYYVGHVPILFDWTWIVLLGVGTLVLCVLSLVVPSFVVSNIRPAKAIKFD